MITPANRRPVHIDDNIKLRSLDYYDMLYIMQHIGADSTGARGALAPLLFKVGGQDYHLAPLDFW